MNKRGLLGGAIVMFVSIIAIVIILLIFAFGSEVVKVADKSATGVSIMDEKKVGIDNVFDYPGEFRVLYNVRYSVAGGKSFGTALVEYEGDIVNAGSITKVEADEDEDEDDSIFDEDD